MAWTGSATCACQLAMGPSWVARRLHDAAEPREHGEAAVLELLDLELLEVTGLGEAEGVEAATRGDVTDGEAIIEAESRRGRCGTPRRAPTRTTSMMRTFQKDG